MIRPFYQAPLLHDRNRADAGLSALVTHLSFVDHPLVFQVLSSDNPIFLKYSMIGTLDNT